MKSNGWIQCTLGEQVTLQRGYDISKAEQISGNIPVISSGGIKSWHNIARESGPGVLLGRKGSIGTVYYTSKDYWPHSTTLFVKDFHGNNPRFVFYFFLFIADFIKAMDVGTSNPTLNRNHLHPWSILWPSLEIQNSIVDILSVLDDKIELNQRINANLERQAFEIFRKMLANASLSTCHLSQIAIINPKRTLKKGEYARCIDMSQLSTSGSFPNGWEMKSYNGGMKFKNGDTLFARITPCLENGKTAYIDFLNENEVAFGSTEYVVIASQGEYPPEFFYCLARYPAFVDYAVKNMNGSSGRQRVAAETIENFMFPMLSKSELSEFCSTVPSFFKVIRNNSIENIRLAQIRDSLLPRLMAGEIDLRSVNI